MSQLICHIRIKVDGYDEREFALVENDFVEIAHREGMKFVGASALTEELPCSEWRFQVKQIKKDAVSLRLNTHVYVEPEDRSLRAGEPLSLASRTGGHDEILVTDVRPSTASAAEYNPI